MARDTILRPSDFLDDDEPDFGAASANRRRRRHRKKPSEHVVLNELLSHSGEEAQIGAQGAFTPTFTASFHERNWILTYLAPFYEDRQITDVLRRAKGGKEANVYCCAAHPDTGLDLIAAKIYRPRAFRQLRNDLRYRQGRELLDERGKAVRDGGLLAAVARKSEKGREAVYTSWVEHEWQALHSLWRAGADVPQPVSHESSVILMEYIGDADTTAPALHSVSLGRSEAAQLFERLLHNVELMLAHGWVHGDLSAYNVLYWEGEARIIDFPQVVEPHRNPEAFDIFQRDVYRLCQYFTRYDIRADASSLAADLWARLGPPPPEPLHEEDLDDGDE